MELLKRQQQIAKLGEAQRAALEVATYENCIDLLASVHQDCGEAWDWTAVKSAPVPAPPTYSNHFEAVQRQKEQASQSGFFARILGRSEARARASERAIEQARVSDQARYAAALNEYSGKLDKWKSLQRVAAGVVAGEVSAFKEAFEELNQMAEIKELGQSVQFSFNQRFAEASVLLHGQERVPREIKSLLKSAKVSIKPATDGFIHQTYQKHACSCVLRVARELFAVLPFRWYSSTGWPNWSIPRTDIRSPKS